MEMNRSQLEREYLKLGNKLQANNFENWKNHCYWRMANDYSTASNSSETIPKPYYRNCSYKQLLSSVLALQNMQAGGLRVVKLYNMNSLKIRNKIKYV